MSLFRRDVQLIGTLIPPRSLSARPGKPLVNSKVAMQQSVIWAAMNLHAAIESMMPADTFRVVDGVKVNIPNPPVLLAPSSFADGHDDTLGEWLYQRRMSLMGWGNFFGEITQRNQFGLPVRIQPVDPEEVTVRIKGRQIVEYRFGRVEMDPKNVWHDRDNLLPGIPVGLSPVAYAMLAIETSASTRRFAADWFGNSATPGGHLRNTEKAMKPEDGDVVKAKFKRSVEAGDVFASGKDWEFIPLQAKAAESGFIEEMHYSDIELCRFFNTPANILDVAYTGTSRIVYANITQANLDFMVVRMGPNLKRTDDALTNLTPRPQQVKLNRSAFLAMDDVTRASLMKTRIDARLSTPDQERAIDDQPPLSEADYGQIERLFGNPNKTLQKGTAA